MELTVAFNGSLSCNILNVLTI